MNRTIRYLIAVSTLLGLLVPAAGARTQGRERSIPAGPGGDNPEVVTAPTQVSYQGRVTVNGVPHNGTGYFKFAIVNQAGTTSFWSNDGTSANGSEPSSNVPLSVNAGLFNVLLGDTSLGGMTQPLAASVFSAGDRYLRVWFAADGIGPYSQLAPDRRIGATPYALNAETLDGQDSSAFALVGHNHFGETWTGNASAGLTISGGTTGVSGSASSTGLYGHGTGVDDTYGVYGRSDTGNGVGVAGYATSSTGIAAYGLYGESNSVYGLGVYGIANATSSGTVGVYGRSRFGTGVYGWASSTSGDTYGVYGRSEGDNGNGVYGYATSSTGLAAYGVSGVSNSIYGIGVYGAGAFTGSTIGVEGVSNSSSGYGMFGYAGATTGTTYGVYGWSLSPSGYDIYSNGNFAVVNGTKSAIVDTQDYGRRHLYTVEAPDNWFEDYGQADLVDGKATVAIEPVFAETVNLNQPYYVYLTPVGAYCPLYVAEQTAKGFTIRVQAGQACQGSFYYRVIAKRLGYEDLRLGPAQAPRIAAPVAPHAQEVRQP